MCERKRDRERETESLESQIFVRQKKAPNENTCIGRPCVCVCTCVCVREKERGNKEKKERCSRDDERHAPRESLSIDHIPLDLNTV